MLLTVEGVTEDKVTFSDCEDSEEDSEDEDDQQSPPPPQKDLYIVATLPRASDNHHPFDVFDLTNLSWSKQHTIGEIDKDVPNVGIGSALSYHRGTHSIYLYSGWNEGDFSSDVYCVCMDTREWEWEKIPIPEGEIKPSPRYRTGMLVYGDKLCHFGGVGLKIVPNQDKGAKYERYADKIYGWNNEYYEFDVLKSKLTIY